jgi:hypothetical protein
MKFYTTDPGAHARFRTSLRDLADFLDKHRNVPVPTHGTCILMHANSADDGGRAQVDNIARLLGADVYDDTADGGHYWAARNFGPLGYEIVAITEAYSDRHHALMSYRCSVTPDPSPDTWT